MARVSSHELFKMVNTNDIERINETIGEWCRVDSEGNHIHTPGCIGVYRELLSYASAKAKNGELSKEITELLVEAFSWYVGIFQFARFATLSGLTSYTPSEKTVIPDWLIGALNTLAEKPNSKVTFTLKNMRYDRLCALIGYLTTEEEINYFFRDYVSIVIGRVYEQNPDAGSQIIGYMSMAIDETTLRRHGSFGCGLGADLIRLLFA